MSRKNNWLPFTDAHSIILREMPIYGIDTVRKWLYQRKYGYNRPTNIPCDPSKIYKGKGWVCWTHWLGTNNKQGGNRKYQINDNYFKKWSHDMAYILGFWFADGCIYKNSFRIDQCKKDKYLLEDIALVMNVNVPIVTYKNMSRLMIYSGAIVDDVKKIGGAERKSLTCKFPHMPIKYFPDFIRGNFDGDGTIYFNKTDGCYESGFCSGSKEFIDKMFFLLRKTIPHLHGRIEIRKQNGYSNSFLFIIKFGRNDTIRLKNFMYQTQSKLFLKRKYNLFQKAGEIKIARNCMIDYKNAELYACSLRIGSKSRWYDFWKINNRPLGIPLNPSQVYKNKGWVSWEKWLGKSKKHRRLIYNGF